MCCPCSPHRHLMQARARLSPRRHRLSHPRRSAAEARCRLRGAYRFYLLYCTAQRPRVDSVIPIADSQTRASADPAAPTATTSRPNGVYVDAVSPPWPRAGASSSARAWRPQACGPPSDALSHQQIILPGGSSLVVILRQYSVSFQPIQQEMHQSALTITPSRRPPPPGWWWDGLNNQIHPTVAAFFLPSGVSPNKLACAL